MSLGAGALPGVGVPGPRPATTALVGLHARLRRATATSVLHRRVALDRLDWSLLPRMDGTLGVEELAAAVVTDIAAGSVSISVDGEPRSDLETVLEVVQQRLLHHGRAGLLVA